MSIGREYQDGRRKAAAARIMRKLFDNLEGTAAAESKDAAFPLAAGSLRKKGGSRRRVSLDQIRARP